MRANKQCIAPGTIFRFIFTRVYVMNVKKKKKHQHAKISSKQAVITATHVLHAEIHVNVGIHRIICYLQIDVLKIKIICVVIYQLYKLCLNRIKTKP